MLTSYLNTQENIFIDAAGNEWRDGFPQLTIRGRETIGIKLVSASPDYGTEAARPETWPADSKWAATPGISAMLTVDNDFKHRIKATLPAEIAAGASAVVLRFSAVNVEEIPTSGIITLYAAGGDGESIGYSSWTATGSEITFQLETAVIGSYSAGSTADVRQTPLCLAHLDVAASAWDSGYLEFDLAIDSARLRSITDYSDAASVAIKGVELLLYAVSPTDSSVRILRSYLWDTPSLINTLGDPGYNAPLSDPVTDAISAAIAAKFEELSKKEW